MKTISAWIFWKLTGEVPGQPEQERVQDYSSGWQEGGIDHRRLRDWGGWLNLPVWQPQSLWHPGRRICHSYCRKDSIFFISFHIFSLFLDCHSDCWEDSNFFSLQISFLCFDGIYPGHLWLDGQVWNVRALDWRGLGEFNQPCFWDQWSKLCIIGEHE